MLFIAFHALVFIIMVGESLGCGGGKCAGKQETCKESSYQGRRKREAGDMKAGHWTFGECSNDEESCLNARYDFSNITKSWEYSWQDWTLIALRLPSLKVWHCQWQTVWTVRSFATVYLADMAIAQIKNITTNAMETDLDSFVNVKTLIRILPSVPLLRKYWQLEWPADNAKNKCLLQLNGFSINNTSFIYYLNFLIIFITWF